MSSIAALVELAFHAGPAVQANELIHEVRQRVAGECGRAVNYEVPLFDRQWDYLEQVVAPRLAFYLRSKSYGVRQCDPVFITAFVDSTVCFIHAADLFELVRRAKGLDSESFTQLTDTWERTGQAALRALPPAS